MNLDLITRDAQGGRITHTANDFRLTIPSGDNRHYRVAQLDDYAKLARKDFPQRPSRSLSLRARASADSIPGTWGFGLWNDPFGLSLGFGGNPFRIPALPNAIWFFHASQENYLSFGEKPGNGFLAQAFRSPVLPLLPLMRVGTTLPFSKVKARGMMSNIVEEDGSPPRYGCDRMAWLQVGVESERSSFWVDEVLVLETSVSPRPPLGLVIWIDNQYAAFTPEGKIGFGLLENTEPAWLEIEDLELS